MFWLQELYPVLGRAAGDRQSAAMAAAQGGGMRWKLGCIGTMDWFKGKFTGKPPYLMGKSMVSCRFSLKPIH